MIIFTDLDGTLLNHRDYSYREALPALKKIRSRRIPLIMCTSNTRREVEILQRTMGLSEPFIVENGGGIFFPSAYRGFRIEESLGIRGAKCIPLGIPYVRIRAFMKRAGARYSIRGFGDMTEQEIADLTGLPAEIAASARAREFTEPFIIEDDEKLPDLERAASEAGIRITRGGRFYHFIGRGNDKGEAVKHVTAIFERNRKTSTVIVGLGDSRNDLPMLEQVDIPILIPHPDGRYEKVNLPGLIHAPFPGSRGWNDALMTVLDRYEKAHSSACKFTELHRFEKRSSAWDRRLFAKRQKHAPAIDSNPSRA